MNPSLCQGQLELAQRKEKQRSFPVTSYKNLMPLILGVSQTTEANKHYEAEICCRKFYSQ